MDENNFFSKSNPPKTILLRRVTEVFFQMFGNRWLQTLLNFTIMWEKKEILFNMSFDASKSIPKHNKTYTKEKICHIFAEQKCPK